MVDEVHLTLAEVVTAILADLERVKASRSCVPERDGGLFVLPNGDTIRLSGNDLAVAVSHLLGITRLDW